MEAPTPAVAGNGAWRLGNLLALGPGAKLPDLCARCGRPASRRWLTAYPWSGRLVWYFRSSAPTLYRDLVRYAPAFEAAIPLCGEHLDERKSDFQNTLAVLAAGLSTLVFCQLGFVPYRIYVILFVLGFAIVAAGIYFARRIDPLRTEHLTATHLWLTGAAPQLLAALPEAPPEMDPGQGPAVILPPPPPPAQ